MYCEKKKINDRAERLSVVSYTMIIGAVCKIKMKILLQPPTQRPLISNMFKHVTANIPPRDCCLQFVCAQ